MFLELFLLSFLKTRSSVSWSNILPEEAFYRRSNFIVPSTAVRFTRVIRLWFHI